jgi:hypothetical protein
MTGSKSPESAPAPKSAPQSEQSKRRLIKWGVAAAVVLVAGWFAWHQYTAHQEAAKTEHLNQSVKQSMQERFDSDPKFSKYHIQVEKVQLIKESGNKYNGIATVRTLRSSDHEVAIEVTADESNMMWQAQPGALMFLAQEDMQALTTPTAEASPSLPPPATKVPTAPNAPAVSGQNRLPDADTQGFLTYQGLARCSGTDSAALIVRTAKSAVVICQSGTASFYYRGLRLSDGGNIELADATSTASGFSVTNPSDGTEYDVSLSGLVIYSKGEVYTESAVESAP